MLDSMSALGSSSCFLALLLHLFYWKAHMIIVLVILTSMYMHTIPMSTVVACQEAARHIIAANERIPLPERRSMVATCVMQ